MRRNKRPPSTPHLCHWAIKSPVLDGPPPPTPALLHPLPLVSLLSSTHNPVVAAGYRAGASTWLRGLSRWGGGVASETEWEYGASCGAPESARDGVKEREREKGGGTTNMFQTVMRNTAKHEKRHSLLSNAWNTRHDESRWDFRLAVEKWVIRGRVRGTEKEADRDREKERKKLNRS